MPSVTEICNLALVESGQDETITDIDERTVVANRCQRLYDITRRELLTTYPWTFCIKTEALARVAEDIEGYRFAYAYPEDGLRILNVFADEKDYKLRHRRVNRINHPRVILLEGKKVILSNMDAPFCEYIFDEKVTDNFSPLFTRMLYLTIGLGLAKVGGVGAEKLRLIGAQIEQEANRARVQSVGEDDNVIPMDDEYIIVRG